MSAAVRRPRLLVITPDFPPARGGIQVLAHRLAAGLRGFDVKVLTLDCAGAADFDTASGVVTRRVRARTRGGDIARNATLNLAAVHEALRFRPQVTLSVHIVVSPAAALVRRALGARIVQYYYAKEIPRRPRLAAFAARQADATIAISSYTTELIARTGVADLEPTLIPPGVDLPRDAAPRAAERPTFVTISRLEDRYKGHDVLIEALAEVRDAVPDVEWIVIGDGSLRPELEARARAAGVADSVRFLGAVSDACRDEWLRRADLLAMPSRLPGEGRAGEGFGIVYLEAGAYGKPVVAGNVAGAVDAIADGKSGLLVDPADPHAVAGAIMRLLSDRRLAQRLGECGAERARRYAWPAIAARLEAVLHEQLPEPAQGAHGAPRHAPGERGGKG